MRSIILIGFMGAGKTTIGKELAKSGLDFLDTDGYIEECEQMTVSRIFSEKGEEYFRRAETQALNQLQKENRQFVISCGGGMPLREENRKLLRKLGMVVYLRVQPETVLARLKGDTTRPLLQGEDSNQRVRSLMNEREVHYKSAADTIIDVDGREPQELAEEILSFFHNFKNNT